MSNPTEGNTLYRCPKCGGDDLRVECVIVCKLGDCIAGDIQLEPASGMSFGDDSYMLCNAEDCEHHGKASEFQL